MSKFNIDSFMSATTTWKEIMLKNFNAALAEEGKDVPVAWMCSEEELLHKGYSRFSKTCVGAWNIPVYTAPPQRKPLTDDEITALVLEWWCPTMVTAKDRKFVRAIERAHGVGSEG